MSESIEKVLECHEFVGLHSCFQPYYEIDEFKKGKQLAITSKNGNDLFDSIGSLYDYSKMDFNRKTFDYTTLNQVFAETEVAKIYYMLQRYILANFNLKVGRVRLMRLEPKTCYTYHKDLEEFRFHLPLSTNKKCFFVVDDQVCRMEELLTLYKLRTNLIHTAVNASFEIRDHLVFDTYKDEV